MRSLSRVIPERAQPMSGTHRHSLFRMNSSVWVPVFRFAKTGMTGGAS
jgi:hypothetical protein